MTTTAKQQATWEESVVLQCLTEAGGDFEAGVAAAEIILSIQSPPDEVVVDLPVDLNAFLAHDIHNKQAQGILNRSLKAARGMTAAARKDLAAALKRGPKDSGAAILKFINKYRLQLAKLLTTTQLASVLGGVSEVAAKVPTLATFPGAVSPPPSLEPQAAVTLVNRLEKLKDDARALAIYALPMDQQTFVQQALAAKEASPPIVPPKFTPPSPPSGAPEGVHFPTIDEAVRSLAEKNVMTRERYDALDAAARAKAFTVAGVDADATLTKIRDVLAENVKKGADYEAFKDAVLEAVEEGTFLSDAHQETVFRTNVQSAFSDGQMSVLNHPLVRSGFPYSAYDSIHDDRVRNEHRELDKLGIGGTNIYRNDDPVFQTFRPPWSYNCRCSWTPITVRHAAERGIAEAKEWMYTGVEPSPPAFVPMPDFQPPPGFQRAVASAPLSIQLSMQSLAMFAIKKGDGAEEETETSLLYGMSEGASSSTSGSLDTAREGGRSKNDIKIKRSRKSGKTSKKEKKKKSSFKRVRAKRRWASSVALAMDTGMGSDKDQRLTLISEILTILYGDDAPAIARSLPKSSPDGSEEGGIALAQQTIPSGAIESPTSPGQGWNLVHTGPRGGKYWVHSGSGGAAPPTSPPPPPPAAPPPTPQPSAAQQPPPNPASSAAPAGPQTATGKVTGTAYAQRYAKATAVHTAVMAKLQSGRALSASEKTDLSRHLAVMTLPQLRGLHTALGGTGALTGSRVAHARVVRGILLGTPAPAPTPPAPKAPVPQAQPAQPPPQAQPKPPTPAPTPPAAQPTKPTLPTIPYKPELVWHTGIQGRGTLNGVDFAPAPPKFWEKVKDVNVNEPKPTKKVDRAGILIQEPDGRIWIVQPTNEFGNRKHTLPGGGVEAVLTVQQNALKEVWEETGLQVEITGYAGDFEDSNNGNNGRLYIGKRVGGAPWDAKIENHITNNKTGKPAAESEKVSLVTPEQAAKMLHRTDDLAQLTVAHPIPLKTSTSGNVMKKLVQAIKPSAKAYIDKKNATGAYPGNAELHVVQNMRGFNKKPKVVKEKDFDTLMAQGGHIEMLRGMRGHGSNTADQLADQFRNGDHFPGHGCFGSGTYADSSKGAGNAAMTTYSGHAYKGGGTVVRMALPKTAKIVKQSELEKAVPKNPTGFNGYHQGGHPPEDCWKGVQAALAGYDAVYVDGNSSVHGQYGMGYYIILNRGILTVQDTPPPSNHQIK